MFTDQSFMGANEKQFFHKQKKNSSKGQKRATKRAYHKSLLEIPSLDFAKV